MTYAVATPAVRPMVSVDTGNDAWGMMHVEAPKSCTVCDSKARAVRNYVGRTSMSSSNILDLGWLCWECWGQYAEAGWLVYTLDSYHTIGK